MNWATLNPLILSVISEIAAAPIPGVPEFRAQFKDRAVEAMSPDYGHALFLKVLRVVSVSDDEVRYDFDPFTQIQTATVCGIRLITLQLESQCTENTDDLWCMSVLDRINTRLQFQRYIDRLRDEGNCAFIDWSDAIDHGAVYDGRMMSIGTMDLKLYAGFNELDDVPSNWIERVVLSSQIDPQTDVTNVLVPP